ncbi:asparaginase, partial [Microvirga sp. 3-52]|nr:asparaginase [Microvirga sp. 3-52]
IVEEYRGGHLENSHQGIICVVNDRKEVIYEKGNIESHVYYRSAMKLIQAIPIFSTNIIDKYKLTQQEAALFTASQRGEKYHQEALESLMDKLGLTEDLLICGASYPLNDEAKEQYIWNHKPKRKLLHNCAGKHLGFLAYAKENGFDLTSYDHPNHPLQTEILAHLFELSETPVENIHKGMDGCGAPVYGVPLKNMAISYLKFVAPD